MLEVADVVMWAWKRRTRPRPVKKTKPRKKTMARTSPHLTAQAQAHEEDQEKKDGKSIPHLRFVHGLLEKPSDLRGRAAFT